MKKLIFITLILTLFVAMSAFASNTRVLTMGNNNAIMVDDANIWLFPSRITNYPGLAIAELANNDVNQFGIHWQFGDDAAWVMATYFEDNLGTFTGHFGFPFAFNPPANNRRIHWFYGRAMGTNNLGLRFSLYNSSEEFTDSSPSSDKESFSYYDAHFGLTADDDSWDLALNLGFGTWTDEVGGVPTFDDDGLFDFSVMGRVFMDRGPNYTYVPHAGIEYHKLGWKTPIPGPPVITLEEKLTAFIINLGIGQIYTPSNNVEAVFDFGIMIENEKYEFTDGTNTQENKDNTTTVPYFKIGLDAEVLSWMDVRFGATSFWQRTKDEILTSAPFSSEDKNGFADNETFLGFGFHWGNFHVDTYADPQLFLEGLNFISGGQQDMNFQISAIYEML